MTDVDVGSQPVEAPEGQPDRRRRRTWLLVGGTLVTALAALAFGLWWRWLYSAHALEGGVGGYQVGAPRPVGATFYSPAMVYPKGERPITLNVHSVTPRITENTAGASVKVLVCHRNDATSHLGSDDLSFCAGTKPFAPGVMRIGTDQPGDDSIILAITTSRLGRVTINGVHVTYRQGSRHGSQDTGGTIVLRAVRPTPPTPPITNPPTVTAVSPASGTASGRTRVVIVGTNFTDTATVRFGDVSVTGKEVSVVTRRRLVVLAPAHVAGTVDVRVVTTLGASPVAADDRFTFR